MLGMFLTSANFFTFCRSGTWNTYKNHRFMITLVAKISGHSTTEDFITALRLFVILSHKSLVKSLKYVSYLGITASDSRKILFSSQNFDRSRLLEGSNCLL